jgi:DNA-binding transcriptional MerR regulator
VDEQEPTSRPASLNLQGSLFDDLPVEERPGGHVEDVGYRGPTACSAAGITYRQLDYWARTGLVEPTVREASGSGSQRLYSFRDILVLRVVKKLLDAGVSLANIRTAIGTLHDRGAEDLAQLTLISDGTTVYECTSTDEMVDLLQGGQAVFAIAVGRQVRDVEGTLASLPGERARRDGLASEAAGSPLEHTGDELANRRKRRTIA